MHALSRPAAGRRPRLPAPVVTLMAVVLMAALPATAPAASTPKRTSAKLKLSTTSTVTQGQNGVQHMHFVYGPVKINPGQNSIFFEPNTVRPKEDGYFTRFEPNLIYQDGTIPRVDVVHLHHAVWMINGSPTWAAGEEKTAAIMPPGYGYPYRTTDRWQMNHMIHNLTPNATSVYITYDLDFVPATAPQAAAIQPVRTQWLDVVGGSYPVFDAIKGTGHAGGTRYTYPDDAADPGVRNAGRWTVGRKQTLVFVWGHLHPGGLYDDLKITRNGVTKLLFRANTKYYEPAGAVSWDVAVTVTPTDWRINVQPGDVISMSGTYDTSRASWYESMAIMPISVADGWSGVDPFTQPYPTKGVLTHGPLAENRNHGGARAGLPNPLKLLGTTAPVSQVAIDDFVYGQGDLSAVGRAGRLPVVHPGESLTFLNNDAFDVNRITDPRTIYHTITACKSPCNRQTGIAYPLADGKVAFDSGELGFGPYRNAAQRKTWSTPKTLATGTYSYFCRIHPFMRGAFRVVKVKGT